MKYITEEDLRDLYRKEPFTDYGLIPGVRLTPGARQFLMDRGINLVDTDLNNKLVDVNVGSVSSLSEKKNACSEKYTFKYKRDKKLYSRMMSIEALFLQTEEELLGRDVYLAQSVIKLGKQFSCIKNMIKNKTPIENLCCNECTGINSNNFSDDLDDCFEISEFHIQLEQGREIVVLHRLRCELNEFKIIVFELYEGNDNGIFSSEIISDENFSAEDIISKVNQIINSISHLICLAFGGKKCQRQN